MADMRLVVAGAAGRMGRALIRTIAATDGVTLAGALERPGSPQLGRDAGVVAGLPPLGISITDDRGVVAEADGILDFTAPDSTVALAELAAAHRVVDVIGTTGLGQTDIAKLGTAAQQAPIVQSGNMSLGVNLLAALVRQAARALGPEFDVEVVEMHHRHKVDAPSGTALLLGRAAAEGRGIDLEDQAVYAREGHTGARRAGTIGFQSLRGGSVVGEHVVILAGEGERVELAHRAESREIFAHGALRAALWARGRKPGLYSMADVLGLNEKE